MLCSPGNMCPPGSERPAPCLQGTYQDLSGQVQKNKEKQSANILKCPSVRRPSALHILYGLYVLYGLCDANKISYTTVSHSL